MSEWKETEFGEIPKDWDYVKASEFCSKVTDGTHDSPKRQDEGKPLITSKHIKGRYIDFDSAYLISLQDFNKINERSYVDRWDVIISMIGEYCGFTYIERNEKIDYAVKNVGLFKAGSKTKALWLHYFLNAPTGKYILDFNKSGSSQPYISLGALRELPILSPPYLEQKAIASVLSSLDDKIDLLHRQNKTLEQMAETLFRQWFLPVRGRTQTGVEEAKEDWEERPLSYFGDIICGKTPSKKNKEFYIGEIPFIKIPDMHGKTFIFSTTDSLTEEGKNSQRNKTLPPKSICVSCIATVGLVVLTTKESQTNQQINSIIPFKKGFRYYLFLQMKVSYDLLHAMASGGTATLNLNTGNFAKINIPLPPEELLEEFHNKIEPVFDKIFINQTQIRTLEKMRDTLLPKLMSGEVRVKL